MLLCTMSKLSKSQLSVPEVASLTYLVREYARQFVLRIMHFANPHPVASCLSMRFIANCSHNTFDTLIGENLERVIRDVMVPLHVPITTQYRYHVIPFLPLPFVESQIGLSVAIEIAKLLVPSPDSIFDLTVVFIADNLVSEAIYDISSWAFVSKVRKRPWLR